MVISLDALIESKSTSVQDLHLWQISENERSLILSLNSTADTPPEHYHELVKTIGKYEHIGDELDVLESEVCHLVDAV